MNYSFKNHKYWLAAFVVFAILILSFYQFSIYDAFKMQITRPEAIAAAEKFLSSRNISTYGFAKEAFLDNSPVEIRYLIKKLGTTDFKKYMEENKKDLSWKVMFHQDLAKQLEHTTYYVDVAQDGSVFGFQKEIPDSTKLPSLSKAEATQFISSHLHEKIGNDFSNFKLIESKEEQYRNRTDFSFRWEKEVKKLNAKTIITARLQGNTIGSFNHYLEIPQQEREYFRTSDFLFGTVSVVLVVFLMMISFFLFLKKYHQGEIWMSVGRTMFLLYFIISLLEFINLWPGLGLGTNVGNLQFSAVKFMILLINGFIMQFFLALLVFAAWTVGESYGRTLWPEKLKSMDGFIKGHFFSVHTGSAVLRGLVIGTGLALTYLIGSIILNKTNSTLYIDPGGMMEMFIGWLPAVSVIFSAFVSASLASVVLTFFIVNISYQRWKKKWVSILLSGFVTVACVAIASTPPSLNNFGVNLASYFVFGCALAFLYFKFDLLTIVTSLFYSHIISRSFILWPAEGTFFSFNFLLVIGAVAVGLIIYALSRIKKEDFVLENYGLPSHILRISERERMKKELEIAAKVQLSLLPKEEPKIPGYDIAAISIPAIEAGGDYFDFVKLSGNKYGVAIGDVSGKGVGAAIYMTLTKGILQAHAEEDVSPKNVLAKVNRLLYKTIEKNSFVSMFYAILDVNRNKMLYSRAGHNPGILTNQLSGGTKLLLSKGMALGLEEGNIFTSTLNEEEVEIKDGDVIVLYTDGFTEAMNEKQELYGEDNLIHLIEMNRNLSAKDLMNLIIKEVNKFTDNYPQHDDMTIVIVKRV